jgi:hypothetical protein
MHVNFRVAVLSVENLKKKCQVVRARRAQPKILDRRDLFFQYDAQFLFIERLLAAKFDDARLLCALFLLFYDRLPRFLSLFGTLNICCALGYNFKCEGRTSEKEKDPALHLSETGSDI